MKFKKILVIFLMAFFIGNIERPVFAFNGDKEEEVSTDVNVSLRNEGPACIILGSQLIYKSEIMVGPPPNPELLYNPERERMVWVKDGRGETIIEVCVGPQTNEFSHGAVEVRRDKPGFYELLDHVYAASNFEQCYKDVMDGYATHEDERFNNQISIKYFNMLFDIFGV